MDCRICGSQSVTPTLPKPIAKLTRQSTSTRGSSRAGQTSERFEESAEPDLYGIADRHGRLLVLMTHDTDISDSWEREGEEPEYFYQFSPNGYALAINAVIYAMTH